jgi:hypothetical protein
MEKLLRELIPHAPQLGLFVAPEIPADKLRNALQDFARRVDESDVLVLYDATLLGSAKDGAVFTPDRCVFQNNDLDSIHDLPYGDIVHVEVKRKLMGGRSVVVGVNRGRATFHVELDFSGKAGAAEFVARFFREAMLVSEPESPGETDVEAVRSALDDLRARGLLSKEDYSSMTRILPQR